MRSLRHRSAKRNVDWRRDVDNRSPEAVLGAIIHDIRCEMHHIESTVAFILNDTEAASIPIENLSRKMAVQEVCELILRRKDTMNDILNMASYYADSVQSPDVKR